MAIPTIHSFFIKYGSAELFSFHKTPKIRDLQSCANKHTYLTKTLQYEDNKDFRTPRALRSKTIPRLIRWP